MGPRPSPLGAWSLSHWITREVPTSYVRLQVKISAWPGRVPHIGKAFRASVVDPSQGEMCCAKVLLWACVHVCQLLQLCLTLVTSRLLCPWDSPGKNTGVSCHALLQGIFTQDRTMSLKSPALQADSFTTDVTWEAQSCFYHLNPKLRNKNKKTKKKRNHLLNLRKSLQKITPNNRFIGLNISSFLCLF